MRRNERKNLPEFPVPGILVTQETISALIAIVENADKEAIRDNIYKGKYRDPSSGKDRYEVRERLRDIYYNKCAYCEDIDAKPEVEHYRPKKKVSEDSSHPGYYWLCYEWTNLLPSCHYCNTESGKRNQFPIRGERTIEICDLKRQNLLLRRQKLVIDPIRDNIHIVLDLQLEGVFKNEAAFKRALDMVFEKMVKMQQADQPFSLLAVYVYEHFNEVIVPLIATPIQQRVVTAAFADFRRRWRYNQNIEGFL